MDLTGGAVLLNWCTVARVVAPELPVAEASTHDAAWRRERIVGSVAVILSRRSSDLRLVCQTFERLNYACQVVTRANRCIRDGNCDSSSIDVVRVVVAGGIVGHGGLDRPWLCVARVAVAVLVEGV